MSKDLVHVIGRTALNLWHGNKIGWFDLKADLIRVPTFSEKFIPNADIIVATRWETAYHVNKYDKNTTQGRIV